MTKRTYRGASIAENRRAEKDNENSSRKILTKSELDEIASEQGFHFVQALGLGNSLYSNENETLKRVYDKYGRIVSTYTPKNCLQNTLEFHHPIACLPANLSSLRFRQYTGRNGFMKSTRYVRN